MNANPGGTSSRTPWGTLPACAGSSVSSRPSSSALILHACRNTLWTTPAKRRSGAARDPAEIAWRRMGQAPSAGLRSVSAASILGRIWSSTRTASRESDTHPKMPPCALIISSATRWNSGKYEPTQSDSTTHS